MLNMKGEDDFEVEYSIKEHVQLVQETEHVFHSMEVDPLNFDSGDGRKYVDDILKL